MIAKGTPVNVLNYWMDAVESEGVVAYSETTIDGRLVYGVTDSYGVTRAFNAEKVQVREQEVSALWTTSEAVRTAPQYLSTGADAAQRMVFMMDAAPADCGLTRDDWESLSRGAERDAQTEALNRLAAW